VSIPKLTGRERAWSIVLNGYPFPVAHQNGVPMWEILRVPDIEGQSAGLQDREREYRSTHSGFGWSQYLAPNTYHYTNGLDGRFPGQVIMGPRLRTVLQPSKDATVGVTGFFEIGGKLYSISGKWVNEIIPSLDDVTVNATFPYDLTTGNSGAVGTMGVRFDANVVIGVTTASGADMVSFNGTTFTVLSTASVPEGAYLTRYYADTDFQLACVFLDDTNGDPSVSWIAQGAVLNTAANWAGYDDGTGADYGVGDRSASLTGLAAVERMLYVAMTDGLYPIDGQSQRAPVLIPAIPVKSTNGLNTMASDDGRIWYPCESGLYVYDPANLTIENVSPGRGLPDQSSIRGRCTALAFFREWTYAAVYNGTDTFIMCGRRREGDEPGFGSYIWHGSLAEFRGTRVTAMHVSAIVDPPRLWFGLLTGNLSYMRLPSNGDNPLNDPDARFTHTGSIYYPADDYGGSGMRWNLSDVAILVEGLTTGSTVTVYERRDLGTWTVVGSTGVNGRVVLQTSGDKRFSSAELRIDIANVDQTSTPVIRTLVGKAARRAAMRDVIQTTVLCYDEAVSRLGIPTRYTGQTLVDQLKTMDDYFPVILLESWTGKEQGSTVLVQPGRYHIVKQQGDTAAGLAVDLSMKVLKIAGLLQAEDSSQLQTESLIGLELE